MIRERPGEKNDRENVISNIDNDRWGTDLEKYRENYDKINWNTSDDICDTCEDADTENCRECRR